MLLLTVPYAEKDQAKALGARWNPAKRRWYVPDGVATAGFEKWVADAGASASPTSSGRVDSYQGKTVVGANYVALGHDCNPFEPCAQCGAALLLTPWETARQHLVQVVARL
ncbi:DUF5710 domain-containing protein [Massilia sp. H6]|uniref:DUF5710 domain-containing protein n=1 Tax=Massilia sp. H6 TaxID=2970464 RepID=UPI002166D0CB|nr:DUF5710 domain-containing protein [Massilia sp. H6]UVW30293.1 DUF5710 domain-containing protein [Massilia sp. H6]